MGIKIPTFFLLLSKLPKKREVMGWIIVTSIITNIFSLVIPLFFMQVYDRIIPNSSEFTLLILTISAVIVILIDTFIIIGRGILSSWHASKFAYSEGTKLMSSIFKLSNKDYYSKSIAEYNECFRSIDKLKNIYAGQLFQSLLDIPFILLFLYGIYYISGKLVLFHIGILTLFSIFNIIYHFVFIKFKKDCSESNNNRLGIIEDILSKIHPLKSQGLEEMLLRKLDIVQEDYSISYFKMKNRSHFPTTLGEFTAQVMIYGTIVIGGIFVFNGLLSLGIISAATMLARRTVSPLLSISRLSLSLSEARMDFENLKKLESMENVDITDLDVPDRIDGLLEIKNVNLIREKTDYGNLKDINLTLDKGNITGIICQDSSAASKLVDVLLGLQKPDSGQVLLDSLILSKFEGIINLPEIAIIPRKTELFLGTILDNITLFKPNLTIQALDTAAFLELNELVSKLPKGYETEVTPFSDRTLPSDLINRISIARALVTRPRVIISNQADNAMNEDTKNMFLEVIDKLSINTSILLLTDNPVFLKRANEIYLLKDSKLKKIEDTYNEI